MPVVGVDGDAVEMGDASFARIPLLQLLQLERDVGYRRVDLAGDEVTRAQRREELRQLAPAHGDELEHEEERDDARVRLGEVAEVVMAGDLAAECRVLLPHAVLDIRVADAVDERDATCALDRLR